ncbi:MAG: Fic family protein [Gammaproteobacteria bacterium]|nr:Fic family protein [Gammaproteobacteria bacterium]
MKYNWQQANWTDFRYDLTGLQETLVMLAEKFGHVSGLVKGLSENLQTDTLVNLVLAEAIKTSEIEGELLSRQDVMSSIRNQLGLNKPTEHVRDKRASGIAELMLDVRNTYAAPLTKEKLFQWHTMLFEQTPTQIAIGDWRSHEEPMQVISGPVGKTTIHFEAPASSRVPDEMESFINWFNRSAPGGENHIKFPVIRSAIAHLYFESIHPFEDGNGRIGRAIAEKTLSQGLGYPVLLSLSSTIEKNKKQYYSALETAQKSHEITPWLKYFANLTLDAQTDSEVQIEFILKKSKFFDRFGSVLNERQTKVIKRMLDEGPKGFEGGMSAKKYIAITSTSKATATRDLQYLIEKGVFKQTGGGRSTRYEVNLEQITF